MTLLAGPGPDLVVGIGASVGGLEALRSFFAAAPPGAGLAYVVVQHLEPSGTNHLPDLLGKATALPVSEVVDGTPVTADHIYVAPPQAALRLEGNVFRLVTPASPEDLRGPIDSFFLSLADACKAAAVAIVLSGNGTDGTLGLKAVSDAGGLTLAQDPPTAKADGMPKNAAAFGPADRVLPPDKMVDELLAYAKHVRALAAAGEGEAIHQQISDALAAVCDVLLAATDHNFKHYKTSTLVRRVGRRMQIHRLRSADEYVRRLRHDKEETAALFKELLIGVTQFFRDPEAFEALAHQALPQIFADRPPTDPVRIWVPGCATGEEAYTLAMLVRERLDKLAQPPEVQIFATDINERSLAVARGGVYPLSIGEDVSTDRLRRFFLKKGNQYHVTKEVRELCLFSAHDLIRDPPFSRLDLISCRNLLIYLGPHLQKKLIPLFHYALRPGGYLFLGPAETITTHRDLFRPVDVKHRISQRLPTAVLSPPVLGREDRVRLGARAQEAAAPGEPDLHLVMQRIVLDEFAPKSVVVNEEGQILCASGGLETYLGIAAGTFQNNVIKLARPGLRVGLRSAFAEALKTSRTVVSGHVTLKTDAGTTRVRLTVQPMPQLGEQMGLYLVVFQDAGPVIAPEPKAHAPPASDQTDALIDQLERELRTTREDLEKTIQDLEAANEEMKSSNEELLSMNEELQSANEELETSKEEIQAANEALARANSDLENLLTSTRIATVFLSEEQQITRFTPELATIYNIRTGDASRPLSDITHKARHMPALPTPKDLRQSGKPVETEVQAGDGRWYIRRALPYRTHLGRDEGMVVTFTDVTALKAAERAVRESERLYRAIGESIPFGVWVCDAEGQSVYHSESFLRLVGMTQQECAAFGWTTALHPDDRDRRLAAWQACVNAGGEWDMELRFRGVDGKYHPVLARGVPVRDETGQITCWAGINLDVSRQKATEGRLRDLAELLKIAPVLVRDLDDRIVFWDRGAEQLYGYTAAEAVGQISHDLLKTTFPRPFKELRDELLKTGEWEGELTHHRQDGSEIHVICRWVLRPGEGDRPPAILVASADIGEQKRAEAALREAARQKDAFLAMLAHELRNPLAPVLNAVQVLRLRGGSDPALAHQRDVIDRQVGQMRRLLDDLLDAARISRGTINVRREPTDLRVILETAVEAAKPGIVAKNHTLRVRLPDGPLVLAGDATRLTQVFSNLLNNAAKYTDPGGTVTLTAERQGSDALVRVADTGIGLPPEMLEKAFDLFAQADQTLDRAQGGLGIGLTLVRRLVDLHGGTVMAASAGPGTGSEFTVRLPLSPAGSKAVAAADRPAARKTPRTGRRRILVVDDNADSADSLALLLGLWKHEVTTAADGPTALAVAPTFKPDVAILDLALPGMNGFQVARELRKLPAMKRALLVAVTGYGQEEDRKLSQEAGFDHHLMKPVDPDELRVVLGET